jgi:hypothetical protein
MAISHQPERRVLILQPTNAEVSTNQVYAARYEWRVDGELTIPVATVIDSLKHTDAAFSIYRVDVSVNEGGTSQYQVLIKSYDTAGLNPVTHVDEYVTITGDKNRISITVLNAAVDQNRSLELTLYENAVALPASDMTVTLIAEDFAGTLPERQGHRILDKSATVMAQRPDLQFKGASVTDDALNNRTVVDMGFIGQYLESDLTLAQHQSLYGTGWVLADGVTSCVGSIYGAITSRTVVPDARGIFRRSKNNGRADGNEDPTGERALGSYQADSLTNHSHGLTEGFGMHSHTGSGDYAMRQKSTASWTPNLGQGGDSIGVAGDQTVGMELGGSTDSVTTEAVDTTEARPKNLAVNVFLKIN